MARHTMKKNSDIVNGHFLEKGPFMGISLIRTQLLDGTPPKNNKKRFFFGNVQEEAW